MRYLSAGINDILLATDFTEHAQRAFDAAVRLARASGAKLHVLHVHEEKAFFGVRADQLRDDLSNLVDQRTSWLERFVQAAREGGVEAQALDREGVASTVILEVADELDAGVLVLSTTGTRGFQRLLHGSTARKVLRAAHRPVLAMSSLARVTPCTGGGSYSHMLYPTDLKAPSQRGLVAAQRIAHAAGARLTLLHVQLVPTIIPSLPGSPLVVMPTERIERGRARLQRALSEVAQDLPDLDVQTKLELHSDIAEAIAEVADREGCDLIMVPRHSESTLGSSLFGHTAERLSKIAPVPLLLFTPPGSAE